MTQKALVVGINKFINYPQATLRGCVNDTNSMVHILTEFKSFSPTDITVITDEQATKDNIITKLQELIHEAVNGRLNRLVFSISSHGTEVDDQNGDETDGKDEAFCPYDVDEHNVILDDQLYDLFIQVPSNVEFEVFLDTCHSGTGLKEFNLNQDVKDRYLVLNKNGVSSKDISISHSIKTNKKKQTLISKGHILWTGCSAYQTSADALINGKYHGVFTYFYSKILSDAKGEIPNVQLYKELCKEISNAGYEQTPQFENTPLNSS